MKWYRFSEFWPMEGQLILVSDPYEMEIKVLRRVGYATGNEVREDKDERILYARNCSRATSIDRLP
jgi:hypothetical protein